MPLQTTTYESTNPSSTPDAAYTRIQKPEHGAENADSGVSVTGDYLILTQTGDVSPAQTSSPATANYESTGAPAPRGDTTYTPLQIPDHDYEEVP